MKQTNVCSRQHTDLGKSVEDTANRSGVKKADRGQAQRSHGGMMDTPASLPACQQVDDGSDGHQTHVSQTKANVASKVFPPWITNRYSCSIVAKDTWRKLPHCKVQMRQKCGTQAVQHSTACCCSCSLTERSWLRCSRQECMQSRRTVNLAACSLKYVVLCNEQFRREIAAC